ncbi:MAG: lipid-A-disaccharide synthase [Planctomycetota bacterium]
MSHRPLFFLVAGETSGDIHAANLICELRRLCPQARFAGLGGPRMAQAGCEILYDLVSNLAIMLLLSVFTNLRSILRARKIALDFIDANAPDLVILIDFPGFNLNLARQLRKRRVRVAYYILPQVWAWSARRWRKLRDRTHQRLAILPFEKTWHEAKGLSVDYVGHPLYDHLAGVRVEDDLRARIAAPPEVRLLGLLPGSRRVEFLSTLPLMLKIARAVLDKLPETRVLIAPLPGLPDNTIRKAAQRSRVPLTILPESTYGIMKCADLCLVASGTATLELAFFETPMIVLYRVSPFMRLVGLLLLRVPHIALVNLVAGKQAVPEYLVWIDGVRPIAGQAVRLLTDDPSREAALCAIREVNRKTGGLPGATARAAQLLAAPFLDEGSRPPR